jgi:hypothetical protein
MQPRQREVDDKRPKTGEILLAQRQQGVLAPGQRLAVAPPFRQGIVEAAQPEGEAQAIAAKMITAMRPRRGQARAWPQRQTGRGENGGGETGGGETGG